jgi:DNA-binding response OmpR family regulator
MLDIVLCSQFPAHILWLDHSFRRANHSCRITTEWDVLLSVVQKAHVDVIVLDAMMGDSEARCRQLRSNSDVPLILVNADVNAAGHKKLLAAGADDVIAPWTSFEEILDRTKSKVRVTNSTVEHSS